MSAQLARVEAMIDSSGAAAQIEALLPSGVRPRQLSARTLLVGMALTMLEGREAFLRNVHRTLRALPEDDRRRLGVIGEWKTGPHALTYRQLEYTFRLVASALAKDEPDGAPSPQLSEVLDGLLEANVTALGEPASSSYAVDWTDHQSWSRPPRKRTDATAAAQQDTPASGPLPGGDQPGPDTNRQSDRERRADRDAAWGHRTSNHPADNESSTATTCKSSPPSKTSTAPTCPSSRGGCS